MAVFLETSLGDIVIDLYTDKCPISCKNFIKLCKMKYYNNALFYEVQKDYLTEVRTKNPYKSLNEFLYGNQAKYFEDEIRADLRHGGIGVVSTCNLGPNKNTADFFITLSEVPLQHLDGKHTIFGIVGEGIEILKKINLVHIDQENKPYYNIRILHTIIIDDPFEDPEGLIIPPQSPEPILKSNDNRLEYSEKFSDILPSTSGETDNKKNEQEIIKATKEHQAKRRAIVLEMINDIPDADIKPQDNILFVCKLNPITQERDLELIFSKYGPIRSCEVVRDWKTGQSLQYAFIEFETNIACEEAYFKMENALIDERRIHVDFSQSVAKMWPKYRKNMNKPSQIGQVKSGDSINEKIELKKQYQTYDGKYKMVFYQDQQNKLQTNDQTNKSQKENQISQSNKAIIEQDGNQQELRGRQKQIDEYSKPSKQNQDNNDRNGKKKQKSRSNHRQRSKSNQRQKSRSKQRQRQKSHSHSHSKDRSKERHQQRKFENKKKHNKTRSRSRQKSSRSTSRNSRDKKNYQKAQRQNKKVIKGHKSISRSSSSLSSSSSDGKSNKEKNNQKHKKGLKSRSHNNK